MCTVFNMRPDYPQLLLYCQLLVYVPSIVECSVCPMHFNGQSKNSVVYYRFCSICLSVDVVFMCCIAFRISKYIFVCVPLYSFITLLPVLFSTACESGP
jgi:hypothetical protein